MRDDVNGCSPSPDSDLDAARRAGLNAGTAESDLGQRIAGVGHLFGQETRHSLLVPHERAVDQRFDMATHYERHVSAVTSALAVQQSISAMHAEESAERLEQVDRLAAELAGRYRRSGKPVPEWIEEIRLQLEEPF